MDHDRDSEQVSWHKAGESPLSEEMKDRILEVALERMVLIDGSVYGLEDDAEPERQIDCAARVQQCRAACCSLIFALTQEEAGRGLVKHDPERPYYIARDPDGFCPHLDRRTLKCTIHDRRPLRCRRFACRIESSGRQVV